MKTSTFELCFYNIHTQCGGIAHEATMHKIPQGKRRQQNRHQYFINSCRFRDAWQLLGDLSGL